MEKVFITGGTGFIGNNLVGKLLEKGYKVKILVRRHNVEAYGHTPLLENFSWKNSVEVVYGDILEPESFQNNINDCEVIIHAAAMIAWWNKIWDKIHRINVIGTRNVLSQALKINCKRFVHISSVAAIGYGEDGQPINEEHDYNWSKHKIVYMETKHEAELEVKKAVEKGLNAIMVNPANVWGVGDIRGRRVPLLKALKFGFPFYTTGGTNFVDVDAVCDATINAITSGNKGERYILGGENLPIKEFLGIIADELYAKKPFIKISKLPISLYSYAQELIAPVFNFQPKPTTSQLALFGKYVYYDSSKAMRELHMPVIPFKECIRKTINFYREQGLL